MSQRLWNKNFTLAVVGMVISALGGVGLNVALSVMVFSQTQSTLLTALFTALSMIPQLVLPLIAGPFIDRRNPLKVLVSNEIILALLFFVVAAVTLFFGFNYALYTMFSLLISCFGVISQLASDSVIPQIMAKENYVRGNAVINVIYPLCSVIVAPVAMILFTKYGMPLILFLFGIGSLADALIENHIKADFEFIEAKAAKLTEYAKDLREGMRYFLNDPAIRSVFLFATVMAFSNSSFVLQYPFFNQSATLTNDHYALLQSINSAGYMVGGLLHYFIKIPSKKRFTIAIAVYVVFSLIDGAFLFMPFALMCVSRFLLGLLGMNSANIRLSAVQNHVPNTYRAKLNAFAAVMGAGFGMLGQLVAGAVGELAPYWTVQVGMNAVYLLSVFVFILPRKNKVRELYNYTAYEVAAEA